MTDKAPISHPSSWSVCSLRNLCKKIGSGATPAGGEANYLPQRVQWALVRSQNVFDRRFDVDGLAYISDEQAERLSSVALQPGDILFNITGDGVTFGRACAVPEQILPAVVNQHVSIIRVNPQLAEPGYVLAYLTHPDIKHYIESFNAGGSRRAITKGHIESFQVPVPPLQEQRAIAHILGMLDDKIELNRRMNETLETISRAVFMSWFVDFAPVRAKASGEPVDSICRRLGITPDLLALFPDSFQDSKVGEIPQGWPVKTIGDIAERVAMGPFGSSIKVETFVPEGVPVISGQHLHGFILQDSTFNFIDHKHANKIRNAIVQRGDVIFTHAGNIGQAAFIPENSRYERYIISQRQFYMRCNLSLVTPSFVAYYFRSPEGQHKLLANASSSGVPSIARPATYLRSIELVLPPKLVLDAFEKLIRSIHLRFRRNMDESDILAALRNTLLPKLISGEIRAPERQL